MRSVTLIRFLDDTKQSLGCAMTVANSPELFICKSLELPWKNNQPNISCIPPGTYSCAWTRSERLSQAAGKEIFTYEILNVPLRSGIRIHSANFFYQLLGCIALGNAHKDLNLDGLPDVTSSVATVNQFNTVLNKELFKLTIING